MKNFLENIYNCYNKREYVDPDPLIFLYDYKEKKDIELVGLLSASLAFGSVKLINRFLRKLFDILGPNPSSYILNVPEQELFDKISGLKYRFVKGKEIFSLLMSVKSIFINYPSMEDLFLEGFEKDHQSVIPALAALKNYIDKSGRPGGAGYLLSEPLKRGACKRWLLFLRWMVRKDAVDLGLWTPDLQPYLLIPLDIHMARICSALNLTKRKNTDMQKVIEITRCFRKISPLDPVKYDFALTRTGIRRNETNPCDTCSNLECLKRIKGFA